MLTLFADIFRTATRTEDRRAPPPPRNWSAPPHWQLPVRDLPGRERF